MDSTSVCYFYSEWGFSYPRAWVNYHPQQLLQNTKGQSTQHSWQQSKEEINFLRVAGIQGTNYHRRKIVSNGSILWYRLFLKPTQASKVRLIWNTQTSPMALFLITGVPICGEKSSVDWNSGKCSAILRKMILALHGNISNEVFGGSTVS